MPLGTGNFFNKLTNINFTVKNNSPNRKIHIFGYPIMPGQTRDLFYIPEITEDDIRSSLVKGELANFIRMGVISIVSSSIDLSQYDSTQAAFITGATSNSSSIASSNVEGAVGTGAQPSVFTFQPGGTAVGNVFTTWSGAYSAAAAVSYLCPTIVIDTTYGTATVPAGTYNMGGITLFAYGSILSSTYTLNLSEGVVFNIPSTKFLRVDGVRLVWNATATIPITITGYGYIYFINSASAVAGASATQPLISVGSSGFFDLDCGFNTFFDGNTAAPLLTAASGCTVYVAAFSGAYFYNNQFTGAGTITFEMYDGSVYLGSPQTATGLVVTQDNPTNSYTNTYGITLSAAGGAQTLPTRPTTVLAPVPTFFRASLVTTSTTQASATTYTLQVSGYQPLDVVRILFNKTQLNSANVTVVDGGSGTPTLGVIIAANVGANGSGFIDVQLNSAATHWTLLGAGSQ